jgi:DNA polymerase III epsilon subunit-like protein
VSKWDFLPRRVLALDCETTGLNSMYDYINSITAVEFVDGELTGKVFSKRIKPDAKMKISVEALKVQGLELNAEDFDSVAFAEKVGYEIARLFPPHAIPALDAAIEFQKFTTENDLNHVPVVAHMASFDHAFYDSKLNNAKAKDLFGHALSPVWICTKTLACHLWPDKSPKKLDVCLAAVGLPPRESEGHDSAEDAIKCGQLYFRLLEMLCA